MKMEERKNLKEGRLITLKSKESMIDLLYLSCIKGLNCLCILDSLTKEYLVQKLLLEHAGVNLDNNLTLEDYKYLVRAMHDMCKWGLYIDKFQTMAEKRQVIIVLTSYNDEIFNKDGKHKLEKPSKKPEAKIIIDFIDKNVKIDINLPKNKVTNENNSAEIQGIKKAKSYRMLNKDFKITSDFKAIVIDNQTYNIPDYFNPDMVKNEDEKTWQMIFYQMFSDDINSELNKRGKECI